MRVAVHAAAMRTPLFSSALLYGALLATMAACTPVDPAHVDAGVTADAGPPHAFPSDVVHFVLGSGAGYGEDELPGVVLGPPHGGGNDQGATEGVLSLGQGGTIVLAFDPPLLDGPGPDLVVFENAFYIGGSADRVFAEPAEVAVAGPGWDPTAEPTNDAFVAFACDPDADAPNGCAGVSPVRAGPEGPFSPEALADLGGDAFDFADVGLDVVHFVRIRDLERGLAAGPTAGFDLDAVVGFYPEGDPD